MVFKGRHNFEQISTLDFKVNFYKLKVHFKSSLENSFYFYGTFYDITKDTNPTF